MTMAKEIRILMIGDVCGSPGRNMLEAALAELQWQYQVDFTIVNGENATGGRGINRKTYDLFLDWGIDCITMGNHTWDNRDIYQFIDQAERLVRPVNYPASCPGVGYRIYPLGAAKIAVVNLIGRTYMGQTVANCPFEAMEQLLPKIRQETPLIFVDFHGEATSEKIAMGRFLAGQVTAVIGTHTHVQTNDARILPGNTAYLTDVGMTGPKDSVLGMAIEPVVERFRTGKPCRFTVAEGDLQLNGALITCLPNGAAQQIQLISLERPEYA